MGLSHHLDTMRDLWSMIRSDVSRGWCRVFHRSMWKVWAVTEQYHTMFCRICGQEHETRIGPMMAPIAHVSQLPVSMAQRWYRYHRRGA
jgi:hypothetical protein